ncbi:MAG: sugar ABC transporter ATP-binding protein [Alicyclobacillus sp.]|nr:sugar ABC transporter ATP-binding protein [Alicyclobacillus sp.]
MLELRGISKAFAGTKVLDNVSFVAYPGEVHALVGQNGAGKSTLMKILSGAYTADKGLILIDGREVAISNPRDSEKAGIGIVYQELSLFPHLTVAQNILFGMEPSSRLGFLDDRRAAREAELELKRLGVKINPRARVDRLNVSQQQICEIAKVIHRRPRIIILDEPTASLTLSETQALFQVIKAMKEDGFTIIFISHHMEEIFEIADRCTVLRDGKVVYTGLVSGLDERRLAELMVGHAIGDFYPERLNQPRQEVALKLVNFGGRSVGPVSLEVRYGEILGISGLVGSGRSELLRMIFGADRSEYGEMYIDGQRVRIRSPRNAIRYGLALVTEDRRVDGLNLQLSVKFNLNLPRLLLGSGRSFAGIVNDHTERCVAEQMCEVTKVRCASINQRVWTLSGGNQQKVAIAKWIPTNARIFLLDEPTKGIDVVSKSEIYRTINRLADEGNAVIVVSSYNPELIGLCDRIVTMAHGKITREFTKGVSEADLLLAQGQ